jgi:RDD family
VRQDSRSLDDFPIREGEPEPLEVVRHATASSETRTPGAVAPLAPRWSAAAADAAAVLLIGAAAILAARALTGQIPRLSGVIWAAGFLLLLWMCATVPALLLFGKTVGMALAELSTHANAAGERVSAGAAFRRWLGTVATVVTAGLALLWTVRSPEAPTPADRLSGHPLTLE